MRNESDRFRHSEHVGTRVTTGAPHRPHLGSGSGTIAARHGSHTISPSNSGSRHPMQSGGTTSEITLSSSGLDMSATLPHAGMRLSRDCKNSRANEPRGR